MAIDANILVLFGEPPEGLDLEENNVWRSDLGLNILIALAVVSVVLRYAARFLQKAGFKADDYFMILAVGLSVGTSILVETAFHGGAGKHVWSLTTAELVHLIELMWALSLNYALAVWAIKLSILLLYIRLFRVDSKSFRFFIYFGIFATSALSFSAAVSLVLICQPLSYFWNQFDGVSPGYCRVNINHLYLAIAVINLSLDLYLLVLPIPRVMRLQMSPRRKLVVCASLFLGIIICIAGALRIYYLIAFVVAKDPSWRLGPLALWSSIEPAIGVVTACMPNLLPLYYWASQRIKSLRYGEDRTADTSTNRRGAAHDANRLPSYVENNLVLRPKEEDEIRLTTLATAVRHSSEEDFCGGGIVVRSEVTQTVEDGPKKAQSL